MNRDEKQFKAWLQNQLLDNSKENRKDFDTEKIIEILRKSHPGMYEKIFKNSYSFTGTQKELDDILRSTEKGMIIRWTSDTGRTLYFRNQGKRKGKKDFKIIGETLALEELKKTKDIYIRKLVEKEIKKAKKEIEKKRNKNITSKKQLKKTKKYLSSSSTFEKDIIKEIRKGRDPMKAAFTILNSLSQGDKKIVAKSLTTRGINSPKELNGWLLELKNKSERKIVKQISMERSR